MRSQRTGPTRTYRLPRLTQTADTCGILAMIRAACACLRAEESLSHALTIESE